MPTDIAINDSLCELKDTLVQDQQMVRNMRTALVKEQHFERVTPLKEIEYKIEQLITAIDAALTTV